MCAEAVATYGAALERLARAYEPDPDRRLDLLQEIHGQSQPRNQSVISIEDVRIRARRLEERVARRNRREYIAAAIVLAGYGPLVWFGPTTTLRLAAGLIITAAVFVVHRLHVRGAAAALPADLALSSALEFHRAQLVRQRDLL